MCMQASQTALNLIAVAIERVRVLTDEEKYQHITTLPQTKFQKDGPIWTLDFFLIKRELSRERFPFKGDGYKNIIGCVTMVVDHHLMLIYKGGWCMPCILFLTDSEKVQLKSFVNIPFVNYNKSKEILIP